MKARKSDGKTEAENPEGKTENSRKTKAKCSWRKEGRRINSRSCTQSPSALYTNCLTPLFRTFAAAISTRSRGWCSLPIYATKEQYYQLYLNLKWHSKYILLYSSCSHGLFSGLTWSKKVFVKKNKTLGGIFSNCYIICFHTSLRSNLKVLYIIIHTV